MIIFYICVFILFIKIICVESMDIFHPKGVDGKDRKGCFDGGGKYIYVGRTNPSDNLNTVLKKSHKLNMYMTKTIYWRRTFITSVLISIFGLYCIQGNIPNPKDFIILFFISFIVVYMVNSLYITHYNEWASLYMKHNLRKIKHLKYQKMYNK